MTQDLDSVGISPAEKPSPSLVTEPATPSVIWVVMGTTGEYSDRNEWATFAFQQEQAARDYVGFLSEQYRAACGGNGFMDWEERDELESKMRQHDPEFCCDYIGTRWWVRAVRWGPPEGVAVTPEGTREATKGDSPDATEPKAKEADQ